MKIKKKITIVAIFHLKQKQTKKTSELEQKPSIAQVDKRSSSLCPQKQKCKTNILSTFVNFFFWCQDLF